MSERIEIKKIVRDGATQSRAALNQEVINEYAEAMKGDAIFPPVFVFYDGTQYFLYDGFHRVEAAIRAGLITIEANIVPGTLIDAQWASYAMNATHGLRRTNEDKRRAITAALKHPNGAGKSDREIARHVGVDHKTVGSLRKELEQRGEIPQIETREVVRNGSTFSMDTQKIGEVPANWGASKALAFWSRVDDLGLNRLTVLAKLQPGVQRLSDLSMTYDEAIAKVEELWVLPSQPIPTLPQQPEFQVGDYVRTHTALEGQIAKIKPRNYPINPQKPLYYLEGVRQPFYAEQLTRIDPPTPAEQPAPPSIPDDWHRRLSPTGLLSLAGRFPDWGGMHWIERYFAVREAFCPSQANDPLLLIQDGQNYIALDYVAECISGALGTRLCNFYRTKRGPLAIMHDDGFAKLHELGVVGIISYRDFVNLDDMNAELPTAPDDEPQSEPEPEFVFGNGEPLTDEDIAAFSYPFDGSQPEQPPAADPPFPARPWRLTEGGNGQLIEAADGMQIARIFFNQGVGVKLAEWLVEMVNTRATEEIEVE